MVKFNLKKKIAKALVFAMVMGTVGIHGMNLKSPVAVIAATLENGIVKSSGDSTVALAREEEGNDIKVTYTPGEDKLAFEYVISEEQPAEGAEWTSLSSEITREDGSAVKIWVRETKATKDDTPVSVTIPEVTSNTPGDEDQQTVDLSVFGVYYESSMFKVVLAGSPKGNYISVDYYTDSECKKLKSTTTYDKSELSDNTFYLGLNLKKGGWLKVYDETMDVANVNPIEIAAQVDKIKVKVDISESELLKALQITIGSTPIESIGDYKIVIGGYGEVPSDTDAQKAMLTEIKSAARAGGATLMVYYLGKTTDKKPAMNTEAKVKIPAAPKAPKVTIDYVNGTYTIPAKTKYIVTTIDANGAAVPPASNADWTELTKKQPLTVDKILDAVATGEGTNKVVPSSAALIVETSAGKKKMNSITVVKVKALDKLTVEGPVNDEAKVKRGGTEVATLTYSESGVTIKAASGVTMAYYDSKKEKFVKATTKEIPLTGETELKIKVLGEKPDKGETVGKFGSAEEPIKNLYKKAGDGGDEQEPGGDEGNDDPADELTATATASSVVSDDAEKKVTITVEVKKGNTTVIPKAKSFTVQSGVTEIVVDSNSGEVTVPANTTPGTYHVVVTVTLDDDSTVTCEAEIVVTAQESI